MLGECCNPACSFAHPKLEIYEGIDGNVWTRIPRKKGKPWYDTLVKHGWRYKGDSTLTHDSKDVGQLIIDLGNTDSFCFEHFKLVGESEMIKKSKITLDKILMKISMAKEVMDSCFDEMNGCEDEEQEEESYDEDAENEENDDEENDEDEDDQDADEDESDSNIDNNDDHSKDIKTESLIKSSDQVQNSDTKKEVVTDEKKVLNEKKNVAIVTPMKVERENSDLEFNNDLFDAVEVAYYKSKRPRML